MQLYYKKRLRYSCFPVNFCEIFNNTFFNRTPLVVATDLLYPFDLITFISIAFAFPLQSTNTAVTDQGLKSLHILNLALEKKSKNLSKSCGNINNMKSKNIDNMKHLKGKSKSLRIITDDLIPLLENASSISSIGSLNELTEESILESSYSDDSLARDFTSNILVQRRNKMRSLRKKPRSLCNLVDRSLNSIPENTEKVIPSHNDVSPKMVKTTTKFDSSLQNELNTKNKKIEQVIESNLRNIQKTKETNDKTTSENTDKNVEKNVSIIIPRRRQVLAEINDKKEVTKKTTKIYSKEHRRRLKKKMLDTQKSPEKSVFLGLF